MKHAVPFLSMTLARVALASAVVADAPQTLRECEDCPETLRVPPGEFVMGDASGDGLENERPAHRVRIEEPFSIGKYEVTFDEWDACVAAGGCTHTPDDANWGRGLRPVGNVNWSDAQEYVRWLSELTGARYRLPSEAEWEYAARAGTATRFPWGDDLRKGTAICLECGTGLPSAARSGRCRRTPSACTT